MPPDLCIACVCLSFRPTYRPSACYSQALGKRPPHSTSAAVPSTLSVDTRPGAAEDLQPRPRAQLRHLPHGMAATKLKQEEHLMTANVTKLENRAVCNTRASGRITTLHRDWGCCRIRCGMLRHAAAALACLFACMQCHTMALRTFRHHRRGQSVFMRALRAPAT